MSERSARLPNLFSGTHLSRASRYRRVAAALRDVDDFVSGSSSDSSASSCDNSIAEKTFTPIDTQGGVEADDECSEAGSVYSWDSSSYSSHETSDCEVGSGLYSPPNGKEGDDQSVKLQETLREGRLIDVLRKWYMEYDVSQASLGGLLQALKPSLPDLPKDPRTVIGKIHVPVIEEMGEGKYVNFGLQTQLRLALLKSPPDGNAVFLTFHVDGLPLFKSSGLQLTPILFSMYHAKDLPPFVVCIHAGKSKPPISKFLKDFVVELKELLSSGIVVKEVCYSVKVRCFVCDAPARSFVKGVQGHTGRFACEHCMQTGYKIMGRTVLPLTNAPRRTDEDFVAQTQRRHHKEYSPLTGLGIGMVSQFPLDYMHLVLQGVVRTLLIMWVDGKKPYKLKKLSITLLNNLLQRLGKMWPSDFNRKPRSALEVKRWKATELRQFILYTCVALLKVCLTDRCYNHFMLLHCAITILCREDLHATKLEDAHNYLVDFFKGLPGTYGEHFQYYNFHCLIHLADCARVYGTLDNFSAFPFENFLNTLKRLSKSTSYPLESLLNKFHGKLQSGLLPGMGSKKIFSDGPMESSRHCNGPTSNIQGTEYTKYNWQGIRLSNRAGDNCITFDNKHIAIIDNFVVNSEGEYVIVRKYSLRTDAYTSPCHSSSLGIFKVDKLRARPVAVPMGTIKWKNVLVPYHGKDYFLAVPFRAYCK